MKIFVVRGAFLNPFELQNYSPLKDKHQITAISSKKPISTQIELPLVRLNSPSDLPNFPKKYPILNRLFKDAQILYGLEKCLQCADIVHVAETYFGYSFQAAKQKRDGAKFKLVSTVWETYPFANESIRGRKEIKQLVREETDLFIAVTEKAKDALVLEGVSPEKIIVQNMGIDVHKFTPNENRSSKTRTNILFVGRLVEEKGIQDLFNVFHKLSKNHKISLTVVGDGPLRSGLSNYKNIHLKSIPYSQMPKIYKEADIFCLPSKETKTWQEQFGMVLLEAMASGLPVVTTNSGAIPEVVGDAALVSDWKNINQLSNNLELLIQNEKLRTSMGIKARKRVVSMFDREKVARSLDRIYNQLACQ